ncbi:MAG: EF-P lysine aminoacylase GenX [Chlamydiales bacterium]|nr:EF-P lysine aminoacylase GenX [Chlamydiales bacterium]
MSAGSRITILKDRADLFRKVRAFFLERNILEVDCPVLSQAAPIDLHIDVMQASVTAQEIGYLHTSAEYGMKRLLAEGIGDIYQMSHVFRQAEIGSLHNPEFTMVEWYRLQLTFEEMIQETVEFIRLFLGNLPIRHLSYRKALLEYAGVDHLNANVEDLILCAAERGLSLDKSSSSWDKDTLLQLLLTHIVEPHLGKDRLDILSDFPASQAALSKIEKKEGEFVALRFEIYFNSMELANGYSELTDPIEQRKRLEKAVSDRISIGKDPLCIDENFLKALEKGIPPCCGVAVGFDRLLLLRHHLSHIDDILPFSWKNA